MVDKTRGTAAHGDDTQTELSLETVAPAPIAADPVQGNLNDVEPGLFPDDVIPDETMGYRVPTALQVAGITYRQLDYWARTDLVKPSIRNAHGSGSQRLYSFKDLLVLKIVKGLLDTGISLQNIRRAVDQIRSRGVEDLSNIMLVSDGKTIFECTDQSEVIDILNGGQGVFGIGIAGAMRDLTGTIADLPAVRIEDLEEDAPVVEDELASRRRARQRRTG